MPLIRKWKRLGLAGQLAVLLGVSMAIIAALVVAIAAVISSQNAGREAQHAADQARSTATLALRLEACVNEVLSTRNGPSQSDASAYRKLWVSLDKVFEAPTGSPAQEQEFAHFKQVLAAERPVLEKDQAARLAHPLGRC